MTTPTSTDPVEWRIDQWERLLPDSGAERIEAAARIVQLAAGVGAELDRVARDEGLANQGDYQVLSVLRIAEHQGRRLTATEAAELLDNSTAALTHRLGRLERLGLARREPHPTDGRSIHLALTPEGRDSVRRMVQARIDKRERWLGTLTQTERATLTALLTKLAANTPRT